MKYLVDTDVVIEHLRGRLQLRDIVQEELFGVSVITAGELYVGATRSHNPTSARNHAQIFLEGETVSILTLSLEIMMRYAETKTLLERKGNKIDDFDILIGATALVHNLTLITRNKKHFERIPSLRLY